MLRFLGIGAQKSGTTWLHRQLLKHPQIGFPAGKEVHFWDRLAGGADIPRYLGRFSDDDRCEGEITPAYGFLPADTIRLIHSHLPDLRLIFIMRNPIERAWSSAQMALARAEMGQDEASESWFIDHFLSRGSLARGDYAACIRNWRAAYDPSQLLLLRYESIVANPAAVLQQCCSHLGVSPPSDSMLAGCAEKVFEGSGAQLPDSLSKKLNELYRPRIAALEKLLGEDFSHWLSAPQASGVHKHHKRLFFRGKRKTNPDVMTLRASGLFDERWYLHSYPDVSDTAISPIEHYLIYGAQEGRDPSPGFNTSWYLHDNPDVAASGANPLLHYWLHGMAEGRSPLPPPEPPAGRVRRETEVAPRTYADFSSYFRQSLFLNGISAPLQEPDKRVLGHMHGVRRHLAQKHQDVDATVAVLIIGSRASRVRRAIDSALIQSLQPVRVLVGRTDAGPVPGDWLEGYEPSVVQPLNSQFPAALQSVTAVEFLSLLHEHDEWQEHQLRILVGELLDHPERPAAYGAQVEADDARQGSLCALRYAAFQRSMLENRPYIPRSTVLYRWSSLVASADQLSSSQWADIDWQLLLAVTHRQPAVAVPCVLTTHHASQDDQRDPEPPAIDDTLSLASRLSYHQVPGLEQMCSLRQVEPANSGPDVAVIIPSFECLDYLRLCIDSVQEFTQPRHKIIVVDNGSSAPVREYLAQAAKAGRLQWIQNDRNLGFTYAVNQGIEAAGPEVDVVLLNNDAVVTEGWLEGLQAVFEEVPDAGLAVSRQVLLAGTKTLTTHSPVADASREAEVNLSQHHGNVIDPCIDGTSGLAELNFAPFFCVYIPRGTLDAIGPLDYENAPHYRSDRLYCEAVRQIMRRRIIYTPHAKLYHFLQRATDTLRGGDQRVFTDMFVRNEWSAVSGSKSRVRAGRHYARASLAQLSSFSPHVEFKRELLPATSYDRPDRLSVSGYECRYRPALEALAGGRVGVPPVREYRLHDCVLVDQGVVLTPDGFVVEESIHDTRPFENTQISLTEDGVLLKVEPEETEAKGLLLKKRGQTNYGHWITELLVRLYAYVKVSGEVPPVIVHRPGEAHEFLRTMFRESIELSIPDQPVPMHELGDACVSCVELTMLTGLSSHPIQRHPAGFSDWNAFLDWQAKNQAQKHPILREMANQMRQAVSVDQDHDRLFITRSDAGMGRKIVNAREIETFFEDQGFRIVDPASYGLREQIAMFAGASQIFGTMCAAYTNTVFSPAQCEIGYLAPVYMNGAYYLDLDAVMGRDRFDLLFCDYAERPEPWTLQSDIVVPLDEMRQWYRGRE